jgi:hypothetical protein
MLADFSAFVIALIQLFSQFAVKFSWSHPAIQPSAYAHKPKETKWLNICFVSAFCLKAF